MKKLGLLFFIPFCLTLCTLLCCAEDDIFYYEEDDTVYYFEEEDDVRSEEKSASDSVIGIIENTDEQLTAIADGIYYSEESSLYYFFADGITSPFSSNVCSGMIVKEPVSIYLPQGISAALYKDGEKCGNGFLDIAEPGKYTLQVKNGSSTENLLRFTVLGDYVNSIDTFTVPDGFFLTRVTKDGEKIFCSTSVSVKEEGDYTVSYMAAATGKKYSFGFTVDRTAPTLALCELNNGKAWGPVSVADLEEGASIAVIRDGNEETYENGMLTKSGNYTLYVRDAASNETVYHLTIMIYFDWGDILLFLAVVLLVGGVAVFFYLTGSSSRVY